MEWGLAMTFYITGEKVILLNPFLNQPPPKQTQTFH
jgi:hypothetical protein